jgi:lipoprotein-anchoring transpeptidase ErfK/SrfK
MIRRPGPRTSAILIVATIAVAAGAWLGTAYAGTARLRDVSPGPNDWTNRSTPDIVLRVDNVSGLKRYSVAIDGRSVTDHVERRGDGLVVAGVRLADGRHRVSVEATAAGIFGGEIRHSWTINVDTQAPGLRVSGVPRKGWLRSDTLRLRGLTEAGSRIEVRAGASTAKVDADADGSFSVSLKLTDGALPLSVTARDRAGNIASSTATLRVDATAPAIDVHAPATAHANRPLLSADITDANGVAEQRVTLDGRPFKLGRRPAAPLAEGVHWLKLSARDAAGNETRRTARILVDSTERLGGATLIRGARGADVKALERALRRQGYYKGALTRIYGSRTEAAVRAFQHAKLIPVDGIAGIDTVGAMSTRIVIDESDHSLTLYRDGKRPLRFGVAVGQPAYPTPTGTFSIIVKVVDPTWTPPDSPWAQGALPIPPGPDNPLGTRWMGLSAPNVGIHGTNDPASIGYSVSHGCIRMQIPDAERLFDLVYVGTTVTIRA